MSAGQNGCKAPCLGASLFLQPRLMTPSTFPGKLGQALAAKPDLLALDLAGAYLLRAYSGPCVKQDHASSGTVKPDNASGSLISVS